MRLWDIIKLSLRMFRARTLRTILTILGMGMGVAAMLFFVSLGYGLQRTLLEKITTADSLVTLDISTNATSDAILTPGKIAEFSRIPGVIETSPALALPGQVRYADVTLDVDTTGTTASFLKLGGTKVLQGQLLDDTQPNTIIISQGVARAFNQNPEAMLGQKISFTLFPKDPFGAEQTQQTLTVSIIGILEDEDNLIYFNLKALPETTIKNYDQLKIKAQSTAAMGPIRSLVVDQGFVVSALSDTIDQANKAFTFIQAILMFFGLVALLVSAIGMFNTMTVALLERTREIGIMKSIGASRLSISLMFIVESTLMGLLGSCAGVIISYTTGLLFNLLINAIAIRLGGVAVNLFYSPLWFVLTVLLFGTFVGFLTGVFPARTAARIDPLDALRYE